MADSRAAIVTGGGSGIGRATVQKFLDQGWAVLATDINSDSGARLLDENHPAVDDGRLSFVAADVSFEPDVEAVFESASQRYERLDCVVNNAGIGGAFGPITETSVEDWDFTFSVLVRGVFLGIKHAARVMRDQPGGGSIVNVASVAGLSGDAGPQAYSAAKASVVHMGKVFATELGPDRIRVNTVCPGAIATPLNPSAQGTFHGSELERLQPLPRVGEADDLASVIFFFGSEQSSFVTGQWLAVDGGLEAAGSRLGGYLGTDPRTVGLVGVNRGNTGVKTTVHGEVAKPTNEGR